MNQKKIFLRLRIGISLQNQRKYQFFLGIMILLLSVTDLFSVPENCNKKFIEVTARTIPAVVNISVWKKMNNNGHDSFARIGEGSGVLVSPNGYIITNYHVLNGGDQFRVTLSSGREYINAPIGPQNSAFLADSHSDIAIIKIQASPGEKLPSIDLGDSNDLRVGEWVIAVGNPFGLRHTVTSGIVSAKGRVNVGFTEYEDFIQTDAAINPGNSGGALVNLQGELVGINTAIKTSNGGYQGVSFAIPINMVKKISKSLLQYGKVIRGWMGFYIHNRRLTQNLYQDQVEVISVLPMSPAARAGLKSGDLITTYNGKAIQSFFHLRNLIATAEVGQTVTLGIVRGRQDFQLTVTVGRKPDSEESRRLRFKALEYLGLEVQELPGQKGIAVLFVQPKSPAASAGLKVKDIILEVQSRTVRSQKDFFEHIESLEPGQRLRVLVNRNGKLFLHHITVRPLG